MMKTTLNLCLAACLLGWASTASADVLELRNGQVLVGQYVGGTAGTIRFQTGGVLQVLETSQALALTFTGGGPTAAPPADVPVAAPPPAPAPAPAAAAPVVAAPSVVPIPVGAKLLVRMIDSVSSNDPKGKRFTTALEADLVVGNVMVAKAGTKVYGRVENAQKAGRFAGQSKLDLRLTELASGVSLVPIKTGPYAQAAAKSIGKTAKGAAAGAAIGAIADGSDGAAKGAAIGAVASGVKKGQAITIPPGSLLEFQLLQSVNVTVAP